MSSVRACLSISAGLLGGYIIKSTGSKISLYEDTEEFSE